MWKKVSIGSKVGIFTTISLYNWELLSQYKPIGVQGSHIITYTKGFKRIVPALLYIMNRWGQIWESMPWMMRRNEGEGRGRGLEALKASWNWLGGNPSRANFR